MNNYTHDLHTCMHTHPITLYPYKKKMYTTKAGNLNKLCQVRTVSSYSSKQQMANTEKDTHILFSSQDGAAPRGQPKLTALALTINKLSSLMMLLLLLHQHVSYGCSQLKHTHNNTHLLEQQGQPWRAWGEDNVGNVTRHLGAHLVCHSS